MQPVNGFLYIGQDICHVRYIRDHLATKMFQLISAKSVDSHLKSPLHMGTFAQLPCLNKQVKMFANLLQINF